MFGDALIFKGISTGTTAFIVAGAAVALAVLWIVQIGRAPAWVKAASVAMRLAAVALIAIVLMEPVLRTREPVRRQNFLFHLYDTSASMNIEDYDGASRAEALAKASATDTAARKQLDDVYLSAEFAFDERLSRRDAPAPEDETDKATDLGAALHQTRLQTTGLPVAGIVLYTDGNSTVGTSLDKVVSTAIEVGVPIYPVGTGPAEPPADMWVEKVIHPTEVAGSVETKITVLIGARGMRGDSITVTLFEGDAELESKRVQPKEHRQTMPVEFDVHPKGEGSTIYKVVIASSAPDAYEWNNGEDFFINVAAKKRRVLYVEGAPRYEYRFLRAAFEDDERFEVTSAVYVTREGELYRQGVSGRGELKKGFPVTKHELFGYDVVVVGNVPAQRFSPEQMAWLRDFVRNRGGGLLFLAGEDSFRRGGFGATALAEALPFDIESSRMHPSREGNLVVPTRLGIERNMFGPSVAETRKSAAWDNLPPLTGLYGLAGLKPGAQTLCVIEDGRGDANPPVVAYQRYGRGVALVCGVSATWFWKFQMPSEDTCYQSFWKEMILILMEGNQGRLRVKTNTAVVAPKTPVHIFGTALNAAFEPDHATAVRLTITAPDGTATELTTESSGEEGMTFEREYIPAVAGLYRIKATAQSDDEASEAESMLLVKNESPEFSSVDLNESLLQEIAKATGGAYVHLSDYDQLAEQIRPGEGTIQRETERSLWDAPLMLGGILALLLGEWLLRRAGGLA